MNLLEYLKEARKSPKTVLHRVLLNRGKGPGVHVFFEGRDEESFFSNYIEPRIPKGNMLFRYTCGGKAGVLSVRKELEDKLGEDTRRWFFVDKDHDDYVGKVYPADVYTTRFYSIENEIVCEQVLVRYIRDLLGIDDHEIEELLVAKFRDSLAQFHAVMLVISAWIVEARVSGQSLRLRNGRLAEVVEVTSSLELVVKSRPGKWAGFVESVEGSSKGMWRSVRERGVEFASSENPKAYIRGKYEMWFFVHFLLSLPTLLNQDVASEGRVRAKPGFGLATAVAFLGPRTPEPPSLTSFLDERVAALVA